MNERRTLPPLLLVLVCVIAYANGLQGDFVYDDVAVTVVNNPFLGGLVGWREVLTWDRPVREFTYRIDHTLWGFRPLGYHLQNLVWHVLNVLLLWRILREMGIDRWYACLAAFLFAIHPINTEAVTWISGRKELLCLFFELCAIWAFLRFLRSSAQSRSEPALDNAGALHLRTRTFSLVAPEPRLGRHLRSYLYALAALVSLCLALFSKQVAVALPLLLVVVAWTKGKTAVLFKRRTLLLLSALAVVTIVVCLTSLRLTEVLKEVFQRGTYFDPSARQFKLDHPILTGLAVWWLAVRLLVFPYPLVVERAVAPVVSWSDPRWMLGALILAVVLVFLRRSRRQRSQVLGLSWVLITWLPTSGLLPATYLLADRYLYIPCVGFSIFTGYWFVFFINHRAVAVRRIGVIVVTLVLAGYAFMTVHRNRDWFNEISLWGSAAQQEPANPKIRFNLGNAYYDNGLTNLAEKEWNLTLSLRPEYPEAHVNLGSLYQKEGELDLARLHYQKALAISPKYGIAEFNLALLDEQEGNMEEAIRLMRSAAQHLTGKRDTRQKKALAYRELARLLLQSGRGQEAPPPIRHQGTKQEDIPGERR